MAYLYTHTEVTPDRHGQTERQTDIQTKRKNSNIKIMKTERELKD